MYQLIDRIEFTAIFSQRKPVIFSLSNALFRQNFWRKTAESLDQTPASERGTAMPCFLVHYGNTVCR